MVAGEYVRIAPMFGARAQGSTSRTNMPRAIM